jgi:hypothetical protein
VSHVEPVVERIEGSAGDVSTGLRDGQTRVVRRYAGGDGWGDAEEVGTAGGVV